MVAYPSKHTQDLRLPLGDPQGLCPAGTAYSPPLFLIFPFQHFPIRLLSHLLQQRSNPIFKFYLVLNFSGLDQPANFVCHETRNLVPCSCAKIHLRTSFCDCWFGLPNHSLEVLISTTF
jgi:hypothetical protein